MTIETPDIVQIVLVFAITMLIIGTFWYGGRR